MTATDLVTQQTRDKATADQCVERGVRLVIIPYTVKQTELYRFIRELCPDLPSGTPATLLLSELEVVGRGEDKLREIRQFLVDKFPGAVLHSVGYESSRTPLKVTCAGGHQLNISWQEMCKAKGGGNHICHTCAMVQMTINCFANTLAKIDKYLDDYNYKPIDHATYHGSHTKIHIECNACSCTKDTTWANLANRGPCHGKPEGPPPPRWHFIHKISYFCDRCNWSTNAKAFKTLDTVLDFKCNKCAVVKQASWTTVMEEKWTKCPCSDS
jgi:hypothetical protein